jgi:mannan endo-1,4-beta-mannosidase
MAVRQSAAALVALTAVLAALAPYASAQTGFIRVSGGDFVDDACNPFYFSGYNTWQILETAGGACCGGRDNVGAQFDAAKANNLTVVRMFAYGVQNGYNVQLVDNPGSYNETALADMDYVVSEAGKRGLKLIVALASNWIYNPTMSGTKCWYTNSTLTATGCDDFFTDVNAIQLYKDYAKAIITRKNTITNLTYADDPTIMAYNLINEGRCESSSCTAANIQSWIGEVAPYIKTLTKQLVNTGEDGFLQSSNCLADSVNPVPNSYQWPLQTGQDFMPNNAFPSVDFTSVHMWPDNWQRTDLDFGKAWLAAHANMSSILGKPMIVEEFGKAYGGIDAQSGKGQTEKQQSDYYALTYSIVENSIDYNGAIKGIAFWRWNAVATASANLASFDNAATISTNSSVFTTTIEPFSNRIAQKVAQPGGKVASCTPVTGSAATATATAPAAPITTTAGRKLMQAAAPPAAGPAGDAANANTLVPVSVCTAYPVTFNAG